MIIGMYAKTTYMQIDAMLFFPRIQNMLFLTAQGLFLPWKVQFIPLQLGRGCLSKWTFLPNILKQDTFKALRGITMTLRYAAAVLETMEQS